MSAAQHTPGPWEVEFQMGRMFHVMTADGSAIADMAVEYSSIEDDSEHEANARLIAAAPDLLEALQEMVDGDAEAIEEAKALGVPFPEEILKAYRKAIAAIAKAIGSAT